MAALKRVAAAGNVQIANLPEAGICSDKALYRHISAMNRSYFGEAPLIEQVPTLSCQEPKELQHVLREPTASAYALQRRTAFLQAQAGRFVAQSAQLLHILPTSFGEWLEPFAVDLRPVSLLGDTPQVLPEALTHVAPPGSSTVNLNRGGTLKDTWIPYHAA